MTTAAGPARAARAIGEVVVLHVGDDHYAVAIGCVQEIVRVPEITRVPRPRPPPSKD